MGSPPAYLTPVWRKRVRLFALLLAVLLPVLGFPLYEMAANTNCHASCEKRRLSGPEFRSPA